MSGIDATDLIAAKPRDRGISAAELLAKPEDKEKPSAPGFVSRSTAAVKEAGAAIREDPSAALEDGAMALFKGAVSMANLVMSGVGALAKSMVTPVKIDPRMTPQDQARSNVEQSINAFTTHQKNLEARLTEINSQTEPDRQEKAMMGLLNIIPDGNDAVGDTVYEKTGSALAGAGALALTTLLTLSPDIATRSLGKVKEIGGAGVAPSKVSSAFDELAAMHPPAAEKLAAHVEQVDPKTAKYMKTRIQKFVDASDKDLEMLGRKAAAADLKDLEANYADIIKGGTRKPVGKEPLDMSKSKEERAAERERVAALRAKEMGVEPKLEPEPIPRRAAEHEGVVAKRRAETPEQISANLRTAVKEGLEAMEEPPKTEAPTTATPSFKQWFAGSKIVDTSGAPKIVYHGTASAFKRFSEKKRGSVTGADSAKKGFFFVDNAYQAGSYASFAADTKGKGAPNTRPVYLRMENPLTVEGENVKSEDGYGPGEHGISGWIDEAKKQGKDGLVIRNFVDYPDSEYDFGNDSTHYIVFKPDQIQHSIGADIKNDIIYFNSGVPVTRAAVESAFRFGGEMLEKIPGVTLAKAKLGRLYEGYIDTFNPEAKGPAARTAGSAIAENFFEQAHREHVTWQQGKERRVYWQKMGEAASMEFIHGFEKGKKFLNPMWEKARVAYKNWAEKIYQQDMKTGFTYDPVDHYMPHLFKDSDGVLRFLQKRYGNKWADPRFIKERGYDLYQDAIDADFSPRFTNPEEIMQARQQASDIAALRTDLLADFESRGVAVKAAKGSERPPEGYSPNSRRSPTGQRYWVMEELDPLMHNAFDSKSLWEDRGLKGDAFRGYMELKNKIVPIKLAASLFHPMHVLHIDASAEMTRASKPMLASPGIGTISKFMLDMATSLPYTPGSLFRSLWDNPKTGYPLLRVFQGKKDFASLSDADKAAYKDLAEGGMVPTRPMEETSSSIQRFKDSFHKSKYLGAAWHFPWAVVASFGHPIYAVWIPSLKIASYLKDVKVARELNPEWTQMQRQEAFRQIARKVEARYGEMNYKSMFMDKAIKDIGVATNLSLGWNIGLLDQYVGGAIDLGRAGVERGSLKEKVASGRLDRPIFAAYYVGSALMLGGLMHKFFTGKDPTQLIDYTHPESGEKDQYGKPVRLNTMWYTREFEGLYKHMQQQGAVTGISDFVLNKGSGLMEMGKAAITGVDTLGNHIRDENDPAYKQLEQTLLSEFGEMEPISLEAMDRATGSRAKIAALSALGFTPAGKYISETVIEGQISNDYNKYVRPKEKPFQAVQMAKDMKDLRQTFHSDDPKVYEQYDQKLDKMTKAYDLDPKDIRKIEKNFNSPKEAEFDPSVFMFSKLPWEAQKPLLDKMSEEERAKYLAHISKSKRQKYERETAE